MGNHLPCRLIALRSAREGHRAQPQVCRERALRATHPPLPYCETDIEPGVDVCVSVFRIRPVSGAIAARSCSRVKYDDCSTPPHVKYDDCSARRVA